MYLLALHYATINTTSTRDLIKGLMSIPTKVQKILDSETKIADRAKTLSQYNNAFFIGRGINCPVAMEGALKLKEVSYIHAEAYPAGELKHGPFALLGKDMPIIAIIPQDNNYDMMLANIEEIKARKSPLIAIADEDDKDIEQFADDVIRIPKVDPLLTPILNTVILQLLAYYTAKERSCSIDTPRNLAKSVTVE